MDAQAGLRLCCFQTPTTEFLESRPKSFIAILKYSWRGVMTIVADRKHSWGGQGGSRVRIWLFGRGVKAQAPQKTLQAPGDSFYTCALYNLEFAQTPWS